MDNLSSENDFQKTYNADGIWSNDSSLTGISETELLWTQRGVQKRLGSLTVADVLSGIQFLPLKVN